MKETGKFASSCIIKLGKELSGPNLRKSRPRLASNVLTAQPREGEAYWSKRSQRDARPAPSESCQRQAMGRRIWRRPGKEKEGPVYSGGWEVRLESRARPGPRRSSSGRRPRFAVCNAIVVGADSVADVLVIAFALWSDRKGIPTALLLPRCLNGRKEPVPASSSGCGAAGWRWSDEPCVIMAGRGTWYKAALHGVSCRDLEVQGRRSLDRGLGIAGGPKFPQGTEDRPVNEPLLSRPTASQCPGTAAWRRRMCFRRHRERGGLTRAREAHGHVACPSEVPCPSYELW